MPVAPVSGNGNGALQALRQSASARETAILAGTIPLWEATPGSGAENHDSEQTGLAGARVERNFEEDRDILECRGSPGAFDFHKTSGSVGSDTSERKQKFCSRALAMAK
jgi:hypothetical protein